ncbi:MAG: hypothetical protein Q8O42_09520 [Acidobacteriota bacterium]|nr:hypothetical protein [Acidobacteriota bacterium]
MLLLLSQTPGVIGALACTITLSAPTATIAPGSVSLAATANTITVTAPTATALETVGASAATITLTAPTATVAPGAVTLAATANTITLSVGSADLAIDESAIVVTIAGTQRSTLIDMATMVVRDVLNDAPNTCTFTCYGFTPSAGQAISVALGSAANLVFAGNVLRVEQFYDGIRDNIGYHVTCQDYTWLLNRRLVTYRWTSTSASTIAAQIMSLFTSGFTTSNIAVGLATVTEFEVVLATPAQALSQLAAAIGAHWYIDYEKNLHFFLTELTDLPAAISDATRSGDQLKHTTDMAQVRTRVIGRGAGGSVTADLAAGATSVPLSDASAFAPGGGSVILGANIDTYGGKSSNDGEGSVTVGPLGSPTSVTPSVSTTKSGGPLGAVKYWRTDVYENGESEPSAVSSTVTPATVSAPGAVSSGNDQHTQVSIGAGLSRTGTAFTFNLANMAPGAVVYIRSTSGAFDGLWSIASVSGSTCTVNGISSSAPASDSATITAATSGPHEAAKIYGVSFVSALGETAIGSSLNVSGSAVSSISSHISIPSTSSSGGVLGIGTWYYWASLTLYGGFETSPVLIANYVWFGSGSTNRATINVPSGLLGDQRISGIKIYRSKVGLSTPWLLATLNDRATIHTSGWTLVDAATTDAQLGGLPSADSFTGSAIALIGIPTTSDQRCTGRRLWRQIAGVWFPLALIADRDTTTRFLDTTTDAQLGVGSQGLDPRPFGGAAINLSFAAGGAGVFSSNFYRSKASGTDGFYCGSATAGLTAYEDTKADEDLGREMPTSSRRRTAAGSTTLRVKDTTKFSSSGGWARAGSQVFIYTGRSTTTGEGNLTGVPASGMGALLAPISADQEVVVEPHLLGVSTLSYAVEKGTRARIYVVVNSGSGQAVVAALEGGDGIHEAVVDDDGVTSVTALTEACTAELNAFLAVQTSITFLSRGREIRSGKTIAVSLGSPTSLSGSYLIQEVTLTEFAIAANTFPLRRVVAAPVRFTFQDFLRRAQLT